MSVVDRIKGLCKEKDMSMSKLEQELGFGRGTIGKWDTASPKSVNVKKVADYFRVTYEYILYGDDKDEKDIAKTMEKIKRQLLMDNGLMFDGELLDKDTAKLLLDAIEQQERMVKAINKKYVPKNHRK